jgi:hypothetical protein
MEVSSQKCGVVLSRTGAEGIGSKVTSKFQVGEQQEMVFGRRDGAGPFWLSEQEHERSKTTVAQEFGSGSRRP